MKKLLIMTFAAALGKLVVCAQEGNLLKNGDFEQGFASWRKAGAIWRVEDGAGYGGTKGLVWECNDAEKYIYPAQYVKLEAGSAYRITALVKVDELKGGGNPEVGFEWFDVDGKWVAGAYTKPVDDNGALKDGWVRYEGMTRPMRSSDARGGVLCMLKKGATGKVRFDNVTFEQVPVKAVNFLCTSAYRDEAADGNLRVLASIKADTNLHVATLSVGLANGDVRTFKPIQFLNDTAVFTVPVPELAMCKQKLAFRLASRKNGRIAGEAEIAFERTAVPPSRRRVSFDSQSRMLLDEKALALKLNLSPDKVSTITGDLEKAVRKDERALSSQVNVRIACDKHLAALDFGPRLNGSSMTRRIQ